MLRHRIAISLLEQMATPALPAPAPPSSPQSFFEVWFQFNQYRARTMLNQVYKVLVVTLFI